MTMIPKHAFGIDIIHLWEYMLRNEDRNLVETITLTNKKGSNLLHLCAENTTEEDNEFSSLLKMICHCPRVSERVVIKALNKDRKGKTPLFLCWNEEACLTILDIVPIHMMRMRDLDSRQNNIMHMFGSRKKFPRVLRKLGQRLPRKELQDLLFERNHNCLLYTSDAADE